MSQGREEKRRADKDSAPSKREDGGSIYWDERPGKELVLGVGGYDQESCFGLVNFEMLVRQPSRDAKRPVG